MYLYSVHLSMFYSTLSLPLDTFKSLFLRSSLDISTLYHKHTDGDGLPELGAVTIVPLLLSTLLRPAASETVF